MNSIRYLRTHDGLGVLRIGPDTVTLQENDFDHAEWSLDPVILSDGVLGRVHDFCAAEGLAPLDWSVMAERRY